MVDLVGEGFDLAIRAGILRDTSLVARRIGPSDFIATGFSRRYVEKKGAPLAVEELAKYSCVLFHPTNGRAASTCVMKMKIRARSRCAARLAPTTLRSRGR